MDPARKNILIQTQLIIAGWFLIWLAASQTFGLSVVVFSVGMCFILPMHAMRLARLR